MIEERGHDRGIELGSGASLELTQGLGAREPGPVGAIGNERVVGIAGENDPGGKRYFFAGEAVGIAAPVPALVLVTDGESDVRESGQLPQDPLADRGVLAHEIPLLVVQGARLVQDRIRDSDLPDVVEKRPGFHFCERSPLEPECRSDGDRQITNDIRVLTRIAITLTQSRCERPDDSPVRLGRPTTFLADPRERGDERLLTLEQAARSIERLPAEVIEQRSIGHLHFIGKTAQRG